MRTSILNLCGILRRAFTIDSLAALTLTGSVHTWAEREEAEDAVWAAPGVNLVEDRLAVVV